MTTSAKKKKNAYFRNQARKKVIYITKHHLKYPKEQYSQYISNNCIRNPKYPKTMQGHIQGCDVLFTRTEITESIKHVTFEPTKKTKHTKK